MPQRHEFGIPDLAAAIVRFCEDNLPGSYPLHVTIKLTNERTFSSPIVHIPPRPRDECARPPRNGTH